MHHALRLLVATDIFGATTALQAALDSLQNRGAGKCDASSPAVPLQIQLCQPDSCVAGTAPFDNDQLAYQAFLQQGGLAGYQRQVSLALAQHRPHLVLGFSAGAAALWCALSAAGRPTSPDKALLCYGGQIRQHLDLVPKLPVTCLWTEETHFEVHAVQQQLAQYHNLQQCYWPQRHGFINPHSGGFDPTAAAEFWRRCQRWTAGHDFALEIDG